MSKQFQLLLVGGARPNFMKLAPIIRALEAHTISVPYQLVHTGQHYDHEMSQVFFDEFGIPAPDYYLDSGGGSQTEQTAKTMLAFEEVCEVVKPNLVLVVGDVNSTLAAALVAKKRHIRVAHVEAGLRSFDRHMPEEINRLATDAISDYLFASEQSAVDNLEREGHGPEQIFFVGQVMVDNLYYQAAHLDGTTANAKRLTYDLAHSLEIKKQYDRYAILTLHRASNTDDQMTLHQLVTAFNQIAEHIPLIFPIHPRTQQSLERFNLRLSEKIIALPPLSYMDCLNLWRDAALVLTDSGGLQEETTALGVPCLTLRHNTERPITVEAGTNQLVGTDPEAIVRAAREILEAPKPETIARPPLWDGKAAERIVDILLQHLNKENT